MARQFERTVFIKRFTFETYFFVLVLLMLDLVFLHNREATY